MHANDDNASPIFAFRVGNARKPRLPHPVKRALEIMRKKEDCLSGGGVRFCCSIVHVIHSDSTTSGAFLVLLSLMVRGPNTMGRVEKIPCTVSLATRERSLSHNSTTSSTMLNWQPMEFVHRLTRAIHRFGLVSGRKMESESARTEAVMNSLVRV